MSEEEPKRKVPSWWDKYGTAIVLVAFGVAAIIFQVVFLSAQAEVTLTTVENCTMTAPVRVEEYAVQFSDAGVFLGSEKYLDTSCGSYRMNPLMGSGGLVVGNTYNLLVEDGGKVIAGATPITKKE